MNNRKYSLSTMLDVDDFLMERTPAPFKSFLTQVQPKEKGRLLATFSFVIPFQNRSVEQVFSKSIRGFRSVDRLIPWR